jgi:hypothetical protein
LRKRTLVAHSKGGGFEVDGSGALRGNWGWDRRRWRVDGLRKRTEVARSKAGVKAAAYSRVGDEAAVSFGTGDGGVL